MHTSTIAPLLSMATVIIGNPIQIWKLFQEKTAREVSLIRCLLSFVTNAAWIFYAEELRNSMLVAANVISAIFTAAITLQILYYRYLPLYPQKKNPPVLD